MKLLFIGTGAIGTYLGGTLLHAGVDVAFVDRPAVAAQLKTNGLSVRYKDKTLHVPRVSVFSNLIQACSEHHYDVIVFSMKAFDTASSLDELQNTSCKFSTVLDFQNGVENESLIADRLGGDRVIAGTVTSAIRKIGIGDVIVEKNRGVGMDISTELGRQTAALFHSSGVPVRKYSDAGAMKWSKMLTNLLANATCAILNMTPAEIYSNRTLFNLEVHQIQEAVHVMKRSGIRVVDLPGVPVRLLIGVMTKLPPWFSQLVLSRAIGRGRGDKMPSFHIDLHNNQSHSEVEYLNGAVARNGKKCGVQTPINSFLTHTLMEMVRGNVDKMEFNHQPERLMDNLSSFAV